MSQAIGLLQIDLYLYKWEYTRLSCWVASPQLLLTGRGKYVRPVSEKFCLRKLQYENVPVVLKLPHYDNVTMVMIDFAKRRSKMIIMDFNARL